MESKVKSKDVKITYKGKVETITIEGNFASLKNEFIKAFSPDSNKEFKFYITKNEDEKIYINEDNFSSIFEENQILNIKVEEINNENEEELKEYNNRKNNSKYIDKYEEGETTILLNKSNTTSNIENENNNSNLSSNNNNSIISQKDEKLDSNISELEKYKNENQELQKKLKKYTKECEEYRAQNTKLIDKINNLKKKKEDKN